MLVLSVSFDATHQQLNTITIDDESGDAVRVNNYRFKDNKRIKCATLYEDCGIDWSSTAQLQDIGGGRDCCLFTLYIGLIRALVEGAERDRYDTREAVDWLIEESDFVIKLTWDDLVAGLRAVESLYLESGENIDDSAWTLDSSKLSVLKSRVDGYHHESPRLVQ